MPKENAAAIITDLFPTYPRVLNQRSFHFCYSPLKQTLSPVISPKPQIISSIEVNMCSPVVFYCLPLANK